MDSVKDLTLNDMIDMTVILCGKLLILATIIIILIFLLNVKNNSKINICKLICTRAQVCIFLRQRRNSPRSTIVFTKIMKSLRYIQEITIMSIFKYKKKILRMCLTLFLAIMALCYSTGLLILYMKSMNNMIMVAHHGTVSNTGSIPMNVVIYWKVPCLCCGFNVEAAQLLMGLRETTSVTPQYRIPLRLRTANEEHNCYCNGSEMGVYLDRMSLAATVAAVGDELDVAYLLALWSSNDQTLGELETLRRELNSYAEDMGFGWRSVPMRDVIYRYYDKVNRSLMISSQHNNNNNNRGKGINELYIHEDDGDGNEPMGTLSTAQFDDIINELLDMLNDITPEKPNSLFTKDVKALLLLREKGIPSSSSMPPMMINNVRNDRYSRKVQDNADIKGDILINSDNRMKFRTTYADHVSFHRHKIHDARKYSVRSFQDRLAMDVTEMSKRNLNMILPNVNIKSLKESIIKGVWGVRGKLSFDKNDLIKIMSSTDRSTWSYTDVVSRYEDEFRVFVYHWGSDFLPDAFPLQRSVPIHKGISALDKVNKTSSDNNVVDAFSKFYNIMNNNNNNSHQGGNNHEKEVPVGVKLGNILEAALRIQDSARTYVMPFLYRVLQWFINSNNLEVRRMNKDNNGNIFLSKIPTPPFDYIVSRTMFELDRFPSSWISSFRNQGPGKPIIGELWVPSQSVVDALCYSGIGDGNGTFDASMSANTHTYGVPIFVIPEGIDVNHYDPSRFRSKSKNHPNSDGIENFSLLAGSYRGDPTPISIRVNGKKKNKVLSIFSNFKMEQRKGWQALLEAYYRSFTSVDPVSLTIKTYFDAETTEKKRDSKIGSEFLHNFSKTLEGLPMLSNLWKCYEEIQAMGILKKKHKGELISPSSFKKFFELFTTTTVSYSQGWINDKKTPSCFSKTYVNISRLPKVILDFNASTMNRLPELYTTHDAFVLSTRGEGWGLPFMEAMSMGLPTIATDWGGQVEYMKRKPDGTGGDPRSPYEYYSLLIYNEGQEDIDERKFKANPHDWLTTNSKKNKNNNHYSVFDLLSSSSSDNSPNSINSSIKENIFNQRHFWRPKLPELHPDESSLSSLPMRYRSTVEERVMGRRGYCPSESANTNPRYGRWATPSVEHTAMHMMWLMDHPGNARRLGISARNHIVKYYSRQSVANVIAKRVEDIYMEGLGKPIAGAVS